MLKGKLRRFVGQLNKIPYIPITNEVGWGKRDVVEIIQISENEINVKKIA